MKRLLVFGDTHIPTRADSIPASFYTHISQTKYDLALVTGDLVQNNKMRAIMPPLPPCLIVKGNMDHESLFDFHAEVTIEDLRFLLLHGTQLSPRGNIHQLSEIAEHVNADIAVHGHTHVPSIDLYAGRLFLNPGTISGATGGWGGRQDASFLELEVSGSEIIVSLYITDWTNEQVRVERFYKDAHSMRQV